MVERKGVNGVGILGGILVVWLLILGTPGIGHARVSGTIIFADSTTQPFLDINLWSAYARSESDSRWSKTSIYVEYKNSGRWIKFNKLRYFEIKSWEPYNTEGATDLARRLQIKNAVVEISTTTGIKFTTEYKILQNIRVVIKDELTGEVRPIYVWFAKDGHLNIRKIVFNND